MAQNEKAGRRTTKRQERLIRAVDERFEQVDTLVGAHLVRWIEDSNLDLHEARALLALSGAKRSMTAAEIADVSGLDLDSAYQAVHSIHGRGLTCEHARRRHELTARGRALMQSFEHAREEGVKAFIGSLEAGEQRMLERVLGVGEHARNGSRG
jgi:hypothetical protein